MRSAAAGVAEIEEALVAHWSQLGRPPGCCLNDHDGLLWYETPVAHLPYNGVIRTRLPDGKSADAAIARLLERFRARGAQLLWFLHPTATPADLGSRLESHGLAPIENGTCMSIELERSATPPPPAGVEYREAREPPELDDYNTVNARYWELSAREERAVEAVLSGLAPESVRGHRYVAYADGEAVGKGYLSLAGPPGVAAIFGMSVVSTARGRGIAGGMTNALLERARAAGSRFVVLQSSDMALGVYRRAGFEPRFPLPVYATAELWTEPH